MDQANLARHWDLDSNGTGTCDPIAVANMTTGQWLRRAENLLFDLWSPRGSWLMKKGCCSPVFDRCCCRWCNFVPNWCALVHSYCPALTRCRRCRYDPVMDLLFTLPDKGLLGRVSDDNSCNTRSHCYGGGAGSLDTPSAISAPYDRGSYSSYLEKRIEDENGSWEWKSRFSQVSGEGMVEGPSEVLEKYHHLLEVQNVESAVPSMVSCSVMHWRSLLRH